MKSLKTPIFVLTLALILFSCEKKPTYNGTLYDQPAKEFCLSGWAVGKEIKKCLSDFRGKIVLMFFGYTHCPDVCPTALQLMSKVVNSLTEEEKAKVQVVFISVDPERDSPEIAHKYASYFGPGFIGLSGKVEDIKKVTKDYMAFYKKVENSNTKEGYLVDHTAYIYLIDQEGVLKLIYPSTKQKVDLIVEDIKKLL